MSKNKQPDDASKEEESKLSVGDYLKKNREEQGLTLEAVHEGTKVPIDALRAIEEGYTVRTLSAFYYKGFVKIYAQYLGIEVDDYLAKESSSENNQVVQKENVVVNDFDLQLWLKQFLTNRRKRQIKKIAFILLGLFLLFRFASCIANRPKKIKKVKVKSVAAVTQTVTHSAPQTNVSVESVSSENASTSESIVPPKSSSPSESVRKNVTLTVRAQNESWLRVKSDGQVVFQSTLRKGAVETWLADEKIEITGRNINELEFELNGKMIGTLGRKDRKANAVIITPDGLSVTK